MNNTEVLYLLSALLYGLFTISVRLSVTPRQGHELSRVPVRSLFTFQPVALYKLVRCEMINLLANM